MKKLQKRALVVFFPILLFLLVRCAPTYDTIVVDQAQADELLSAILHVGIEQRATGKVGGYGFKTYIYLSAHPQIVGIDPRVELKKQQGKGELKTVTNTDYVRFGTLDKGGRQLGKLTLADKTGDILKGTFWDSYDVTRYLKRYGTRRYYLAALSRADRNTYAIVGIRSFLEVSTINGKHIRSGEVYFLGKTEGMQGYLTRDVRNVGVEIAIDVPETVNIEKGVVPLSSD
jgi:hypothetical protein